MKNLLLFCCMLLCCIGRAQSVDSLKHELSYHLSGERFGEKIALARRLHQLLPFDRMAVQYICQYYGDRRIDSAVFFLDQLVRRYPDSVQAYLLKAECVYFAGVQNPDALAAEALDGAYRADSSNIEVNSRLAALYYEDFLKPYYSPARHAGNPLVQEEKEVLRLKSVLSSPEDKALFHFCRLWELAPELRKEICFPIRQLEKYKNKKSAPLQLEAMDKNDYFPCWYFLELPEGWESDLSRNYLREIRNSPSRRLEGFLRGIGEPGLYKADTQPAHEVYRFTWLRTFHEPVCIRLENKGGTYMLNWKLLDGKGGYDFGKLAVSGSRELLPEEKNRFIELFGKTGFQKLPAQSYRSMFDGASWLLEHRTPESFRAHYTNVPEGTIQECCVYLLKLTGLEIDNRNIY